MRAHIFLICRRYKAVYLPSGIREYISLWERDLYPLYACFHGKYISLVTGKAVYHPCPFAARKGSFAPCITPAGRYLFFLAGKGTCILAHKVSYLPYVSPLQGSIFSLRYQGVYFPCLFFFSGDIFPFLRSGRILSLRTARIKGSYTPCRRGTYLPCGIRKYIFLVLPLVQGRYLPCG